MRRRWSIWLLTVLWWCVLPGMTGAALAQTADFGVRDLIVEQRDGIYQIGMKLDVRLSDEMLDALRSGVALVFVLDIEINRPRTFWWDANLVHLEQRYQLRYHALSQSWLVRNLNTDAQSSFHSLGAALESLAQVKAIPVVDAALVPDPGTHIGRVRLRLDTEALPLPLKMRALTHGDWRVASNWTMWLLQ